MNILWGTTRPQLNFSEALAQTPFLATPAATSAAQSVCHQNGVQLAARSNNRTHAVHQHGPYIAAIVGAPRFTQPNAATRAQSQGNAAALIDLYREQGKNAMQHIHGEFSLVIADTEKRSLFFAIDRAGTQALCFNMSDNELTLGTTTDLVTADTSVSKNISPQALFNYLFFHAIPSPGTIYLTVEKLQPGECALFENGRLQREFYWAMPYAEVNDESFSNLAIEFRQRLSEAVTRAGQGKSVGAFLSGGTDSSTIAGLLTGVQGHPAETFSIGFQAEGFDETEYARIAARHFGTNPHEYYVTPDDVVTAIPQLARAYDEPFGNASAVPTYLCAKLAQESGITTLLAGDGGDELFGGNARYSKQKTFEFYRKLPAALRLGLIEPISYHTPLIGRSPLFSKAQSYIEQANTPLPDRLESYNFMARMPLGEMLEASFIEGINPHAPIDLMRDVYGRTNSTSAVNRMMHLDLKLILADNDLRKVGMMCALAGVDVHYPLLDDDVMTFSAKLPPNFKVKGYKLRWFFKEALKDYLPHEILTKSKHGFGLPFGLWMQQHDQLHQLAYDSLGALRQRGYINPKYLDHLLNQHRTSHASYYGVMIWVLMMLEQWLQAHQK